MQIDTDGRSYRHGEVVAQSIKTDTLIASAGRQDIDGTGTVGNCYRSEGSTMQGSADGKHQDGTGSYVSCKEDGKSRQTDHQHFFTGKSIHHISAEGTDDECRHRISTQHDADDILGRPKGLTQIEWEEWGEEIEGKVEQKVGGHHLDVIRIPKFLFHFFCIS